MMKQRSARNGAFRLLHEIGLQGRFDLPQSIAVPLLQVPWVLGFRSSVDLPRD